MATPADQRLLELLDRWLTSLELHSKYSSLDEESYRSIQPWPEHQRPVRWIVDLAKQKALALQSQVRERIHNGDPTYSESLELMTFLANLVGSEHIQRFIPLAHAENERPLPVKPDGLSQPAAAVKPDAAAHASDDTSSTSPGLPALPAAAAAAAALPTHTPPPTPSTPAPTGATGTREMPKFSLVPPREPPPVSTPRVVRTERRADVERRAGDTEPKPSTPELRVVESQPPAPEKPAPELKPAAAKQAAPPAAALPAPAAAHAAAPAAAHAAKPVAGGKPSAAERRMAETDRRSPDNERRAEAKGRGAPSETMREQVIADAARLVQWGRKWYELAEIIAGMADRPHLTDVRRILKDNKTVIEKKAGRR